MLGKLLFDETYSLPLSPPSINTPSCSCISLQGGGNTLEALLDIRGHIAHTCMDTGIGSLMGWFNQGSFNLETKYSNLEILDLDLRNLCACMHAKSLQSCPSLCNPMDYSLPGSSVHGILQARILEWVAMPSSRGSSDPGIKPMS